MSLCMMVPSRGRPDNIVRLLDACRETSATSAILVIVDKDDPELEAYGSVMKASSYPGACIAVQDRYHKIGPILNGYAPTLADGYEYLGFMGDDHVPLTPHWDDILVNSLDDKPGVAYANDQFQGENLPTMCVMDSRLVRGLGYFVPPGLVHLYLDNFWKELGTAVGNLQYLPDVCVEHVHPLAGKAKWDKGYEFSCDRNLMDDDRTRYETFMAMQWQWDLDRLRRYPRRCLGHS
jgi:hypothetical protein